MSASYPDNTDPGHVQWERSGNKEYVRSDGFKGWMWNGKKKQTFQKTRCNQPPSTGEASRREVITRERFGHVRFIVATHSSDVTRTATRPNDSWRVHTIARIYLTHVATNACLHRGKRAGPVENPRGDKVVWSLMSYKQALPRGLVIRVELPSRLLDWFGGGSAGGFLGQVL